MARGRSTPYGAQLQKFLREDDLAVFSAATLERRFDHPQRQKRGTNIGRIHKALMKAFAEGDLITFIDDHGHPLRESEIVVPGSKAIGQPQFFGRPGVESPDPAFHALTYEETLHRGLTLDSDEGAAANEAKVDGKAAAADSSPATEGDEAKHDDAGSEPDGGPVLSVDDAIARLRAFPPPGATAPEWIDNRVLREWASLPTVSRHMVHGLDTAQGIDKFELIRAGVTRKRSSWRTESTVAGNLATLCRTSAAVWWNITRTAVSGYLSSGAVPPEDLPRLATDLLDFYEASDTAPEAVLLCAMALNADEDLLELVALDCARELGELEIADKATAQEERIQILEAEASELRRHAKKSDKELRDANKREKKLVEEVEALRDAQVRAGEAADVAHALADEKLRARAEEAEEALQKLERERIPELEAQLEGLDGVREQLERAEAALHEERTLRIQAEQDAKRLSVRVRAMTDELSRAADSRNLPTDSATALLDALLRPIGQAARHAAERLSTGRPKPHDDLLLELAAGVAQMSRRLDAEGDADTAVPVDGEELGPAKAELKAPVSVPEDASIEPEPEVLVFEPSVADQEAAEATEPDPASGEATPEPEPAAPHSATPRRVLRRRSKLKVRPLGGAGEVGGSAILVTNNSGHAVLLDCGQRVRGEYGLDTEPQFHRSIGQEGRLHAILLSHAHIDHVGSLPILHRLRSEAQHEPIPVYMTQPTRELAEIMLEDSAKIQESRTALDSAELGFLDYGSGTMEPAYRRSDVSRVLSDEFVREVTPALAVPIPDTSFVARFIPVAHVLGSCAIHLTDTENDQTLLYTGDLGPIAAPQVTLPQYSLADMLPAHLVVMESTYGSQRTEFTDGRQPRRSLSPRDRAVKILCQRAEHAHNNGGIVLLPAFSLGRTQELALLIDHAKRDGQAPAGDIIVAGMGERITQVYESYSKGTNAWARAETMPRLDELGRRKRQDPSLTFDDIVGEVLDAGFSYVIASPAMLGSGWSRTFLTQMVDNPAHAVVMSGYVPRHGGHIPRLHTLHKGETIDLGDDRHRIQCEFDQLKGLSAHAPSADLHQFANYVARQGDNVAFAMVHGDEASQAALAEDISALPGVASAAALHNGEIWQPTRP
jgi:Cft2 family RNA processing exonuclease